MAKTLSNSNLSPSKKVSNIFVQQKVTGGYNPVYNWMYTGQITGIAASSVAGSFSFVPKSYMRISSISCKAYRSPATNQQASLDTLINFFFQNTYSPSTDPEQLIVNPPNTGNFYEQYFGASQPASKVDILIPPGSIVSGQFQANANPNLIVSDVVYISILLTWTRENFKV